MFDLYSDRLMLDTRGNNSAQTQQRKSEKRRKSKKHIKGDVDGPHKQAYVVPPVFFICCFNYNQVETVDHSCPSWCQALLPEYFVGRASKLLVHTYMPFKVCFLFVPNSFVPFFYRTERFPNYISIMEIVMHVF